MSFLFNYVVRPCKWAFPSLRGFISGLILTALVGFLTQSLGYSNGEKIGKQVGEKIALTEYNKNLEILNSAHSASLQKQLNEFSANLESNINAGIESKYPGKLEKEYQAGASEERKKCRDLLDIEHHTIRALGVYKDEINALAKYSRYSEQDFNEKEFAARVRTVKGLADSGREIADIVRKLFNGNVDLLVAAVDENDYKSAKSYAVTLDRELKAFLNRLFVLITKASKQ